MSKKKNAKYSIEEANLTDFERKVHLSVGFEMEETTHPLWMAIGMTVGDIKRYALS